MNMNSLNKDISKRVNTLFSRLKPRPLPQKRTYISIGENTDEFNSYLLNSRYDRAPFEDLRYYRYKDPMVFTGINLLVQAIIGTGFFTYPGPAFTKESEICTKIIINKTFKPHLGMAIGDALGYGDGYLELIWAGNNLVDSAYINPDTIEPKWDKKGKITRYEQITDKYQNKKVILRPDQVMHLKFWSIEDNIHGIGLIEPMLHRLYSKRSSEKSSDEAIDKYSNPSLHGTLKEAEDKDLKDLHKDLINFKRTSVFSSTDNLEIKLIGEKKNFPDFSPIYENILDSISGCLRVPKETLLPKGKNLNRSSLEFLIKQSEKELVQLQQTVSSVIELQIFTNACIRKGLFNIPDLGWNTLSIDNEKERAEINNYKISYLTEAVRAGLISREVGAKAVKKALAIEDTNV